MAAKKSGRNPAQSASRVTRATPAKPIGSSPGPKSARAAVDAQRQAKPGQQAAGLTKAAGRTASTPKPGRGTREATSAKGGRTLFEKADANRRRTSRT